MHQVNLSGADSPWYMDTGGTSHLTSEQEVHDLIEEITMNSYQWYNPRSTCGTRHELHHMCTVTSLTAQELTNQLYIYRFTTFLEPSFKNEQVNFVGSQNR